MTTAARVAASKLTHPDQFCPVHRCLWRTGGGRCPRHAVAVAQWAEESPTLPGDSIQSVLQAGAL